MAQQSVPTFFEIKQADLLTNYSTIQEWTLLFKIKRHCGLIINHKKRLDDVYSLKN